MGHTAHELPVRLLSAQGIQSWKSSYISLTTELLRQKGHFCCVCVCGKYPPLPAFEFAMYFSIYVSIVNPMFLLEFSSLNTGQKDNRVQYGPWSLADWLIHSAS